VFFFFFFLMEELMIVEVVSSHIIFWVIECDCYSLPYKTTLVVWPGFCDSDKYFSKFILKLKAC
jgi:hypothetical protein